MKRLHLICNAHIDPVWQWTRDEGISAAIATFASAAELCDEYDYIFCHNESLLYEAVEEYAPELFEKIRRLVKEGKWVITGGWYLQPDCNMPSGESFVRQIYEGRKYFSEKFGACPSIATNYDSFGHSIGLAQILKKTGFRGYILHRASGLDPAPGRFFNWEGPDGSSVIVCKVDSYGSGMGHAAEKIRGAASRETTEDVDTVLWGVGNHGGGPSRKDLADIAALEIPGTEIIHSTPERLFDDDIKISGTVTKSLNPSMPGCATSMMKIKQAHQRAENLLWVTEEICAAASLAGMKYDESALERAQNKILLAQFHDILPGSSALPGERDGLDLLDGACEELNKLRMKSMFYLTTGEEKAKEGEYPVFVFNPLPYEVTVPVEAEFSLADQNWSSDFVFRPYIIRDGKRLPCQQIKENSTLNLDWRKRIAFEGTLAPMAVTRFSVMTEKAGRTDASGHRKMQTASRGGCSLVLYDDTADPWAMSENDLHGLGSGEGEEARLMTDDEAARFCVVKNIPPVHIIEDGDVFTATEELVTVGDTRAAIEYRSYKNHGFTDVKVTVEFNEKNKLLRLRIPVDKGTPVGDGPYVTEPKRNDSEVIFTSWLGTEKDGVVNAVISDSCHGAFFRDGAIEFDLLRGSGYLFHPIGDRPLYPDDRYLPRIDCGRYEFRFRILKGDVSEVVRQATAFSRRETGVNIFPIASGHKGSVISADKPVVMPVCRGNGDNLIMRFFNPSPQKDSFSLNVQGNRVSVDYGPGEVVSVRYRAGKFEIFHDELIME